MDILLSLLGRQLEVPSHAPDKEDGRRADVLTASPNKLTLLTLLDNRQLGTVSLQPDPSAVSQVLEEQRRLKPIHPGLISLNSIRARHHRQV